MRYLVVLALLFFTILISQNLEAKIYKCKNLSGGFSFSDKPCLSNEKEEVMDIKEEKSKRSAKNSSGKFSARSLVGKWCEYAVSMELNGAKDSSAPATWNFKNEKSMSYTYKSKPGAKRKPRERFNKYKVKAKKIAVDNGMIGTWEVVSFGSYTMVLSGPYGGYAYLKRGGC